MMDSVTLTPIATIHSCYPERFGIPRQAGLVPSAEAEIVLTKTEENRLSLRGIEQFSHLWVIFLFHGQHYPRVKPLVQPPRLGGRKTMGVYATRSPNRINPIGLSAVRLESVQITGKAICLQVTGGDFLDGTPVLDIKPYVGYADAIATARAPWQPETLMAVTWSDAALQVLHQAPPAQRPTLQRMIEETLAQDPRPAHERGKDGQLGQQWNLQLALFSVFWSVTAGQAQVTQLVLRGDAP
ncbi:MAG: tRNA (N6-threonylcarbamoyladenosine(37)-N6)-methyltransferase TrmO [Cyanobacteria bacterium J06632_22]